MTADELKKRCHEIIRPYFGQPISKEVKREICSAVHGELIKAFSEILIKKEPTDIRILSFGGDIIIYHGKLYLDDWIDDVWGPPVITGNIHRRIRKD